MWTDVASVDQLSNQVQNRAERFEPVQVHSSATRISSYTATMLDETDAIKRRQWPHPPLDD